MGCEMALSFPHAWAMEQKRAEDMRGDRAVTRAVTVLSSSTSVPSSGDLCWGTSHLQLQSAPEI